MADHVGVENQSSTDTRDAVVILSVVVIFFALLMLPIRYDAPNVVDCLDAPIMHVEVTPGEDRRGNIVERHAMGCTWYWYEGAGGD